MGWCECGLNRLRSVRVSASSEGAGSSVLARAVALMASVALAATLGACSGSPAEEGADSGSSSTVAQAQGTADSAGEGAEKDGANSSDSKGSSSAAEKGSAAAANESAAQSGDSGSKAASSNDDAQESNAANGSDQAAAVPEIPDGSSFSVTYFDVGQGDSALVQCDGAYLLIDGGPPSASSLLYSALSREGITYLDYVVATHPDTDHTGGIAGALEAATAGRAFCSVTQADQRSFNAMVDRLSDQNVALEVPEVGDSWELGSALVQVIGPVTRTDDGDANNDSVMLKITYGSTVFVFTGDADSNEEKDATTFLDGCDVLKVAHHGSAGSSCYAFLRAAMPKNAVISCSNDNSYGHPTDDALSRLRDCGATVYRTDMQGDVIAESDGNTVTMSVARNADADTLVAGPGGGLGSAGGGTASAGTSGGSTTDSSSNQGTSHGGAGGGGNYIGNVNSKKFHLPTCSSLPAEHNRVYFDSRDEAVNAGMVPCKRCKP